MNSQGFGPVVDFALTVDAVQANLVDLAVVIYFHSSLVVVINTSSFIWGKAFRLGWLFLLVLYLCVHVNQAQK